MDELYTIQNIFSKYRDKYNKLYLELLKLISQTKKSTIEKLNIIYPNLDITVLGYGDSYIVNNVFDTSNIIFEKLLNTTNWTTMKHKTGDVPRLISVQYILNEHLEKPIYRHPVDVEPPTEQMNDIVLYIKKTIEDKFGFYPFNHVLVQLYRNGLDHIKHHSDKTLDIKRDTPIINVSFGQTRNMTLKSKFCDLLGKKDIINVEMTNGSMFVLGSNTNRYYTHGIKPNKQIFDKRISLTFRCIDSFLNKDNVIYGIGNKHPKEEFDDKQNEKMLIAFGKENKCYQYTTEEIYGDGFDIHTIQTIKK
jgi:alkylated DNA repair dioxygenase AlkB